MGEVATRICSGFSPDWELELRAPSQRQWKAELLFRSSVYFKILHCALKLIMFVEKLNLYVISILAYFKYRVAEARVVGIRLAYRDRFTNY